MFFFQLSRKEFSELREAKEKRKKINKTRVRGSVGASFTSPAVSEEPVVSSLTKVRKRAL